MNSQFIKLLYRNLLQNNFNHVESPENSDYFKGSTKNLDFSNHLGQDLCYLRIFNVESSSLSEFIESHNNLHEQLTHQINQIQSAKIYIVYLFFSEKINEEFFNIIEKGEEFIGQEIYTIYWGIEEPKNLSDINRLKFFNSKKQPTELANIHKIINKSEIEYFKSTNILPDNASEIKLEVEKNDPFKKIVNTPFVSYFLIIINSIFLGITYLNGGPNDLETLSNMGALVPKKVFQDGEYYRLFTVMFLHGSFGHYFGNAFCIYIFGSRLEKYSGHVKFLFIYIITGLCGSVVGLIFIDYIAVGASGAIYGLIGAFLALCYVSRKTLDGFSLYFMVFYCSMSFAGSFFIPEIANSVHTGGFISGFILGYIIFKAMSLSKK